MIRSAPRLTEEQRRLARSVLGLAERVARDVARRHGAVQPLEQMVTSAHFGVVLAAVTYAEEAGPFHAWAYYKAFYCVLDDARTNRRQRDVILAARLAAIEFRAHAPSQRPAPDPSAPNAAYREGLTGYKQRLLASMLAGVAALAPAPGGEDEMIDRLDAFRSARALRRACEGLRPEQIAIVRASDKDLEAMAPELGKSFWTLARERTRLRKLVGARLVGQRIDATPQWSDEAWTAVAQHVEAAANDEGAELPERR